MNAPLRLALIVTTAVVLGSPAGARATVQARDAVRFEGRNEFMMEVPLNHLLGQMHDLPPFEWQTTANWKGYTAGWEVKDGALFLVSFAAKSKGKDVPLEAILPGRKLPVRADWYTGRIRIPIGEPVERGHRGLDGSLYARLVVLHVVKGRVARTEELKNTRLRSYTAERDAERARHGLWTFPRLEAGTVRAWSLPVRDKFALVLVPPAVLRQTPAWGKDRPDPPLSAAEARRRAEEASRMYFPPEARYTWKLDKVERKKSSADRHYYEVTFWPTPSEAFSHLYNGSLRLIVLMDGTVPRPVLYDAGGFMRTVYAGGLTLDERPESADWERPDQGAPWSDLPGWARAIQVYSLLAAPKLLYTVDKLEVYPNGVWAEYTVTNGSPRRAHVPPERSHMLLRNAGFWGAGERWLIPRPNETVPAGKPTEFVPIEPRQSVRYRVLISDPIAKPLKPFGLVEGRPPGRPAALEYFIHAWPNVFTRPSEEAEAQVLAFGYGRVPVTWFDRDYPNDWPRQERLGR